MSESALVCPIPDTVAHDCDAALSIRLLDDHAIVHGHPAILHELRDLFPGGCVTAGSADRAAGATLIHLRQVPGSDRFTISVDDSPVCTVERSGAVAQLEWLLVTRAVEHARSRYLLLHAGAVALGDTGVILCAGSGSGKSTLTAGLVADGFTFLSDEVAVITTERAELLPFPRSMCVKDGSRAALGHLYPAPLAGAPRLRFGDEPVWYLAPPPERLATAPVEPRVFIVPTYKEGTETTLIPMRRSEALQHALSQSFTGAALGAESVGVLVALLRDVECYRMTVGSLPEAVATVRCVVTASRPSPAPSK